MIDRRDYRNRAGLSTKARLRGRGQAIRRRMRAPLPLGPHDFAETAAELLGEATLVTARGRGDLPGED